MGQARQCFVYWVPKAYCRLFWGVMMNNRAKALILSLGLAATGLCATLALARSAPPLTKVEILKVISPACGMEDVADGRAQTLCNHGGGSVKVYVLEIGLGREPFAALDGFAVEGTRAPVCQNGTALLVCEGSGITVGHVYTFDLAGKDEGTFVFRNTSINAPGNTLQTQIYIK